MRNRKITGLPLVVLLVLQVLGVQASHSAQPGSPALSEEVSKQTGIYSSRGEKVPEGYVVNRSLLSYAFTLPAEFKRSLAGLGPGDRWLDIGAGEGRAVLDYSTSKYESIYLEGREPRGAKARAVAISIEDRRTRYWHDTAASLDANQIRYLFGKRLREYALEELGKFQLITDLLGGFSYTERLALFMEKTLALLELNGSFYTLLQDVNAESGTHKPYYPGSPFLTEITAADGSEVKLCSWLKRIACVEVTCEAKTQSPPPVEVYRVRKVCNDVAVPALVPVHFQVGTPPERRFQLANPSPASPGQASTIR